MSSTKSQCLILACGNSLRGDDGVGPWLAEWAEQQFANDPRVRVLCRLQWTPDLAADIADVESVLFIDCSTESAPGEIKLRSVEPATAGPGFATHHTGAAELLALAQELYSSRPRASLLLTIGAGSTELDEAFSPAVTAAIGDAQRIMNDTIRGLLA
jgi:hydrogenase maturation protease